MKWAGCVTHMGEMRIVYTFWSENLKWRPLRRIGVNGRIILKRILENRIENFGLNSSRSGWGLETGCCENDNETSGSIKGE